MSGARPKLYTGQMAGPWRHIALYILGVQRAGARQTVTEHRDESIPDERLRRCRKGEGRDDDLASAGRCKARGTSINPAVHDDTAIACRAPVRLQTASSKARTVAPTVTIPDSQLDSRSAATSRRGSVGRMMGKSSFMLSTACIGRLHWHGGMPQRSRLPTGRGKTRSY